MSRSRYRVAKSPICCGSNTEYYREMNRCVRRYNKQVLGVCLRSESGDAPPEAFRYFHRNDWLEPTDGSWIISPLLVRRGVFSEDRYVRALRK